MKKTIKAPVEKAPVEKAPVEKAPVEKAPVEKAPVTITGLTVKGTPADAVKVHGDALKNGKENAHFEFDRAGVKYIIPVNFDSFDAFIRANLDAVKGADVTATYKIREAGKTVREDVREGVKIESLRAFYDPKGTGGIDTASITYDREGVKMVILYVNRASKFREVVSSDAGAEIAVKVG